MRGQEDSRSPDSVITIVGEDNFQQDFPENIRAKNNTLPKKLNQSNFRLHPEKIPVRTGPVLPGVYAHRR